MRVLRGGVVALAVVAALVPMPAALIERWYSNTLYPPMQRLLTSLTNLLPFAFFDILIVAASVAVVVIAAGAVGAVRRQRRAAPALAALGTLATAVASVYLLFLLMWGLNYRRVPIADRFETAGDTLSRQAVLQLGLDAAAHVNDLHDAAHADPMAGDEWRAAPLRNAFAETERLIGDPARTTPGRLKTTLAGPYFRWASVDGMVNPLGLEVLVNPDLLPFERPFVAAHEWAHLAGHADESEANFIGWLTCVRGGAAAAYSGWMFLHWQISAEVGPDDRATLGKALSDGAREDVNAVVARLRRDQWPALQTAGWAVYDQYLKANRVDDGIRSYSAVITLLLRTRFAADWVPVRRAPFTRE